MQKNNGFTLLEVMIALTIFALIATTLSQSAAITVDNQIHIERKLLATWIAENQIIELRSINYDDLKNNKTEITYGNREWVVSTLVTPRKQYPGIPLKLDIKTVSVSVSLKEQPDSALQTLTAEIAND